MNTAGGVERLLGTHKDTVFALCLRVLRHRQDAEDACQETLLKVARHGPVGGDPARLTAWIHQCALRTAIDLRRSRLRRKAREDRVAAVAPADAADAEAAVAEALAELPDEERTLLVDHFFGRKTLRVLADERGCSEPAVWKRVEKGKEHLRKVLMAAVPSAVGALSGFLEAAEAPSRWTPWRVAVTTVVPALVVAVLATLGMTKRREQTAPPAATARVESSAAVSEAEKPKDAAGLVPSPPPPAEAAVAVPPYPYELPPRHWPEAKRAAWAKLDRMCFSITAENALLHEVLDDLSTRAAVSIRLAPDLPVPVSRLTFKAKDLLLRNCLKLLLSQYGFVFDFGPDGTLWIRSAEGAPPDPDPRFDAVASARAGLNQAVRLMDGGKSGAEPDRIVAALRAKEFFVPPGEYGLWKLVDRFRVEADVNFHLLVDFSTRDPENERLARDEAIRTLKELHERARSDAEKTACLAQMRRLMKESPMPEPPRRTFQGGHRTLEGHLQELSTAWGVGWAPMDGVVGILDPEKAVTERSRAEHQHRALAAAGARLQQPVAGTMPTQIYQLAEGLSRETGLKVVPSEKAWSATIPASGTSWQQILDGLSALGFRWILQNETVYIDR